MPKDRRQRFVVIARDGLELGRLLKSEVTGLLTTGFLRETDVFRSEGESAGWVPLREWDADEGPGPARQPWLNTATRSIFTATSALASQAGKVTGKIGSIITARSAAIGDGFHRFLEDYLPEIRKSVAAQTVIKPALTIRSAIGNDELMRKLFGAVHDCLPKPIRRFVPESVFVEFCLLNRRRLLDPKPAVTIASPSCTKTED